MLKLAQKLSRFRSDVARVAVFGLLTVLVLRPAMAGIFPPCTTYRASCGTNVSTCCLGLGGWDTSTPTGQTLSAIPVTPATMCAAQYKPYLYFWCATLTGGCGGAATSSECE